jgi:hypothetical protein
MYLVGFTMEICYEARPYERQIHISFAQSNSEVSG